MARTPTGRRPHHYRRDSNHHTPNLGSTAPEFNASAMVGPESHAAAGALSPQLDAALHAAAAVDSVEQKQAVKP